MLWPIFTILATGTALVVHLRARRQGEASRRKIEALERTVAALELQAKVEEEHQTHRQDAIFNSMIEGFLLLDSNHRVASINNSLQRIFTVDGDIRGLTLMEAFRLHELGALSERVDREGQVRGFELALPGIHNLRYLEVNASALFTHGQKYQGSIFIFHDVTRLKQLENLRKEFVANVSHELRTPLTLIKGYVETLLDGARDDPQVCEKFLNTIHKHSNRLAALIEDLLNISRLESGQVVLNKRKIALTSIAVKVIEELHTSAAAKKITVINNLPPEAACEADGDRIQQVFLNLIDNAIKYGKSAGTISVNLHRSSGWLQLSVQDDGPGIPPESLERVFERFYRVDRARAREAGGTGLGLSIVKHIVQSHGGEVWVESNPGEGSTFYFTLPDASPVNYTGSQST